MTGLPGDTTGSVPTTKKRISMSHTFFGFPMQIFYSQVCNGISKWTLNSLLLKAASHLDLQWVGILLLVEGLASMLMATDLPVWLLKVGGGSYGNVSTTELDHWLFLSWFLCSVQYCLAFYPQNFQIASQSSQTPLLLLTKLLELSESCHFNSLHSIFTRLDTLSLHKKQLLIH